MRRTPLRPDGVVVPGKVQIETVKFKVFVEDDYPQAAGQPFGADAALAFAECARATGRTAVVLPRIIRAANESIPCWVVKVTEWSDRSDAHDAEDIL